MSTEKIHVTKRLLNGSDLVLGRGFVSNRHWMIRDRIVVGVTKTKATKTNAPASKILGRKRRYRIVRTDERRDHERWPAVLFVGRGGKLRVWINEFYADALGLTEFAYSPDDVGPVTDGQPPKWNVAVMAMMVGDDSGATRKARRKS